MVAALAAVAIHSASISRAAVVAGTAGRTITMTLTQPPQPPPSPRGFRPLTASNSQLVRYGFPPRPSGGALLDVWKRMMAHYRYYVPSHLIPPRAHRGFPRIPGVFSPGSTRQPNYSTNWAGYEEPQSVHPKTAYTTVYGCQTMPAVLGDSNYPNSAYGNAPTASFWVGLNDGNGKAALIQAGRFHVSIQPCGTERTS
jgi:hypothetical protein